mmetsp:Transcript_50770/g.99253  ORF Transcript_50770/g.99253 Transcript_50770/m.99253 type:complete len:256 (+) Transcript_50770:437-1204(+)
MGKIGECYQSDPIFQYRPFNGPVHHYQRPSGLGASYHSGPSSPAAFTSSISLHVRSAYSFSSSGVSDRRCISAAARSLPDENTGERTCDAACAILRALSDGAGVRLGGGGVRTGVDVLRAGSGSTAAGTLRGEVNPTKRLRDRQERVLRPPEMAPPVEAINANQIHRECGTLGSIRRIARAQATRYRKRVGIRREESLTGDGGAPESRKGRDSTVRMAGLMVFVLKFLVLCSRTIRRVFSRQARPPAPTLYFNSY